MIDWDVLRSVAKEVLGDKLEAVDCHRQKLFCDWPMLDQLIALADRLGVRPERVQIAGTEEKYGNVEVSFMESAPKL